MKLYHATDECGAAGIRADGFAESNVKDSEGSAWFADADEDATTGSAAQQWLVIVELPEEVAELHRYRFDDGTSYLGNFLVPFDVVNTYRPFRFERID